jgi:hypothetical protein
MIVIHSAKKNLRKHRRKKLIDGVTHLRFARLQLTGRLPSRPRRPSTAKEWRVDFRWMARRSNQVGHGRA